MKYIDFNSKRLGPLTVDQYEIVINNIDIFDDVNILGDKVYFYKDSARYVFNLNKLTELQLASPTIPKEVDLSDEEYSLILDVGASFGSFCIPLASKRIKFIALEYDFDFFDSLATNIELNKKSSLIQPVLISSDLASTKKINSINTTRNTTLYKIIKMLESEHLQMIRFDKKIDEKTVENILSNIDKQLLPKYLIHDNAYIEI